MIDIVSSTHATVASAQRSCGPGCTVFGTGIGGSSSGHGTFGPVSSGIGTDEIGSAVALAAVPAASARPSSIAQSLLMPQTRSFPTRLEAKLRRYGEAPVNPGRR